MPTYKLTEVQVKTARTFPWKAYGNKVAVSSFGVTDIELVDGVVVVTAIVDGKTEKTVLNDWEQAKCSESSTGFACKVCGETFPNAQGLGSHRKLSKECKDSEAA